MGFSLKHLFTSGKADGPDPTLVQPSNWNAEHSATMDSGNVLGRVSVGTGAVEELSKAQVQAFIGLDTDGTLAANSDASIASQKAVKTYIDGIIGAQDAMVFKGVIDCSTNPNYPAADRGWTYRVSVAGRIGGASGVPVEVGDILLCLTDGTVSGDQATVGSAWSGIQVNIDGALTTAGGTITGNLQVNGTLSSTGNLSENGNRVYSAGNLPPVNGLGVGQQWQDVTSSRAYNVVYQNTHTSPIAITVHIGNHGQNIYVSSDGVTFRAVWSVLEYYSTTLFAIVPPGHYYKTDGYFTAWYELS